MWVVSEANVVSQWSEAVTIIVKLKKVIQIMIMLSRLNIMKMKMIKSVVILRKYLFRYGAGLILLPAPIHLWPPRKTQ